MRMRDWNNGPLQWKGFILWNQKAELHEWLGVWIQTGSEVGNAVLWCNVSLRLRLHDFRGQKLKCWTAEPEEAPGFHEQTSLYSDGQKHGLRMEDCDKKSATSTVRTIHSIPHLAKFLHSWSRRWLWLWLPNLILCKSIATHQPRE